MKKLLFCLAIFPLLFGSSCDKEKPPMETPSPEIPFWKRVQGTYKVTDLYTGEEFNMEIKIKTDTNWLSATQMEVRDTIFFFNFTNSFFVIPKDYINCITEDNLNCVNVVSPHGITDYENNRWVLYSLDDTSTVEKENVWINGEITFYFRMNNMAYWQPDGTFYQDLYKKQKAVKVSDE